MRAIELDPQPAQYAYLLGVARQKQRAYAQAEPAHLQATVLAPDDGEYHHGLGICRHFLGAFEAAEAAHLEAVRCEPACADYHYQLALSQWELGKDCEAREAFLRATELRPNCTRYQRNLAGICHVLGMLDNAESACQRALNLEPDNPAFLVLMRDILADRLQCDEDSHLADEDNAQQSKQSLSELHADLAAFYLVQGRCAEARSSAESAVRLEPKDARSQHLLGSAMAAQRDVACELPLLNAAYLEPEQADYRRMIGTWRQIQQEYRGAARALVAANSIAQGAPPLLDYEDLVLVADAYLDEEDHVEATKVYTLAVQVGPQRYEGHLGLGSVLLDQGDPRRAVDSLMEAARLAPGESEPQLLLAMAYLELGRVEEAFSAKDLGMQLTEALGSQHQWAVAERTVQGVAENSVATAGAGPKTYHGLAAVDPHTMSESRLRTYCAQRVPIDAILEALAEGPRDLYAVPLLPKDFDQRPTLADASITGLRQLSGGYHRASKKHNFMRPVLYEGRLAGRPALFYAVSPGQAYFQHHASMLKHLTGLTWQELPIGEVRSPKRLLRGLDEMGLGQDDIVVLGAVQELRNALGTVFGWGADVDMWEHDNELYSAHRQPIGPAKSLVFLGVKYSYWGDLAGQLALGLAELGCSELVYCAKLGAMTREEDLWHRIFSPNRYLVFQNGREVAAVDDVKNGLREVTGEKCVHSHVSVPTMLEERHDFAEAALSRGVETIDNELGYIAVALSRFNQEQGRQVKLTPLHYATDLLELEPGPLALGLECGRDELLAINRHVAAFRQAYALDYYARVLRRDKIFIEGRNPLSAPSLLVGAETMRIVRRVLLKLEDLHVCLVDEAALAHHSWDALCRRYHGQTVKTEELALLKPRQVPAGQGDPPMSVEEALDLARLASAASSPEWAVDLMPQHSYEFHRLLIGEPPLKKFGEILEWPHETPPQIGRFIAECRRILEEDLDVAEAAEMARRAVDVKRNVDLRQTLERVAIDALGPCSQTPRAPVNEVLYE